ncbi:preprotein translocase subunit YajC [Peptostreptococcus faecalis]|uniref:preprotein translocase subunit YajC n=1 Tax=Peptostreptococcus faecalis TaxID=2045015 RepID=UPI000C7CF7F2|nr:preprotein translocase subunit YajC [Peptostreptococcus faecalis]
MPQNQMIMSIGVWILIFAIFYFILIRPQRKKEQKLKDMRNSIEKGDTVITIGGIIAKVAKVEEDKIVLDLGPSRTKVPFEKWAIGRVVEKASKDEEVEEVEDKLED